MEEVEDSQVNEMNQKGKEILGHITASSSSNTNEAIILSCTSNVRKHVSVSRVCVFGLCIPIITVG